MLHILLLVLKIIGIILLVLIGIILLLIALVLFVPIRYQISVDQHGETIAHGRISWFGHVVRITFDYVDKQFHYYARVIGSLIMTNDESKEIGFLGKLIFGEEDLDSSVDAGEKHKESSVDDEEKVREETSLDIGDEEILVEEQQIENEEILVEEQQIESEEISEIKEESDALSVALEDEKKGPIQFVRDKIDAIKSKIKEIQKKLRDTKNKIIRKINQIKKKIKMIKKKKDQIENLLKSQTFKDAWKHLSKEIKRLIKHVRPRKIRGEFIVGTDNPALTGQIFGVFGLLLPYYRKCFKIRPDFEKSIFEGQAYMKGRIRIIVLLFIGIRLVLDKKFMATIKRIRVITGGN